MVSIGTIVLSGREGDEEAKSTMVRIKEQKPCSDTKKMFNKQCIMIEILIALCRR